MAKNNILEEHSDIMEVVIYDIPEKGIQYRLAISLFRGVHYLSIREWYASYDNEFAPTNNGFTIPYSMVAVGGLYQAITHLLSKAETLPTLLDSLEYPKDAMNFAALVSKELAIPVNLLSKATIQSKTDHTITLDYKEALSNEHTEPT